MSQAKELKELILLLNQENRRILGNSQYAFPLESESRAILAQMARKSHIIIKEAHEQIKRMFFDDLYWEDGQSNLVETTRVYVWSLCYPVRFSQEFYKNQPTARAMIEPIQDHFMISFEKTAIAYHQGKPLKAWAIGYARKFAALQFKHEMESLELYIRQQKELEE